MTMSGCELATCTFDPNAPVFRADSLSNIGDIITRGLDSISSLDFSSTELTVKQLDTSFYEVPTSDELPIVEFSDSIEDDDDRIDYIKISGKDGFIEAFDDDWDGHFEKILQTCIGENGDIYHFEYSEVEYQGVGSGESFYDYEILMTVENNTPYISFELGDGKGIVVNGGVEERYLLQRTLLAGKWEYAITMGEYVFFQLGDWKENFSNTISQNANLTSKYLKDEEYEIFAECIYTGNVYADVQAHYIDPEIPFITIKKGGQEGS